MNNLNDLNNYALTSVNYEDETLGNLTLANRYTINGLVGTESTVLENLEKICSAAGSWLSYDIHQGKWAIIVNKAGTSQYSFNDSNIIGPLRISSTGIDELYNSVKVSFPHEDLRNQTDFVSISIPSGDRYPNEVDNVLELNYGLVTNPVQAQLLGFIELKQNRVDKVVSFQTDYSKISVKAGDIIDITNSVYNFTNKLFRVITVKEVDDESGNINIEIIALEYDATVYDESNLTKYTRTDNNGIVTLGNLVAPATPTVTKYETDSRPRIEITTSISGGVADQIEFWLSTDVPPAVTVDANRTYNLLTTTKPTTGNVFPLNTNITVEVDSLSTSDFLIKAKALNHEFSSPFSSPSGVINYAPQQATDLLNLGTTVSNQPESMSFSDLAQMAALSFAINGGVSILGNIAGNVGTTLANTVSTFFANTGILGNAISNVFSTGNTSQYPQGGNVVVNNPPLAAGDGISVNNGVVSISPANEIVLNGQVFPCLFGSSQSSSPYRASTYVGVANPGATGSTKVRQGIFTHKTLILGNGNAAGIAGYSISSGSKKAIIDVSGSVGQTYAFNLSATDLLGNPKWLNTASNVGGNLYVYTATCSSYNANVGLAAQDFGNWNLLLTHNGEIAYTGTGAEIDYYVVDNNYNCSGSSTQTPTIQGQSTNGTTVASINKQVVISVPTDGLVAIGVSCYPVPDGTPFSGNTVLGTRGSGVNASTSYSFPGYTATGSTGFSGNTNINNSANIFRDQALINTGTKASWGIYDCPKISIRF